MTGKDKQNHIFQKSKSDKIFSTAIYIGEDREYRGLSESIKKGKFVTKIFFSDNVEWSSKMLWKMMSADVKANTKQ